MLKLVDFIDAGAEVRSRPFVTTLPTQIIFDFTFAPSSVYSTIAALFLRRRKLKCADFANIDVKCKITIYLLDIYSFVDNVVYPMEQVVQRMLYYKFLVQAMLETLGVPPLRVRYVQESTCQLTERFQRDFWRLATLVPQQAIRDSWDRAYYPHLMGPMLAPLFQALSEEHLGVDFQFGGADQVRGRKSLLTLVLYFLPPFSFPILSVLYK
jgi:hypothetical protein